jgi:hypothetical protein
MGIKFRAGTELTHLARHLRCRDASRPRSRGHKVPPRASQSSHNSHNSFLPRIRKPQRDAKASLHPACALHVLHAGGGAVNPA